MTAPAPESTVNAVTLDDIRPFADFCRELEKRKLATRPQLQHWLRYRRENGLLASGAVVEKRVNPESKKAMLFVVRPRFVAWLAGQAAA